MIPLPSMSPGQRGRLVELGGERSFRRRLMEMGLLPGTEVRLVRIVRVGGMVELEARGCHLSLRKSEADELLVTPIDGPLGMPIDCPLDSATDGTPGEATSP